MKELFESTQPKEQEHPVAHNPKIGKNLSAFYYGYNTIDEENSLLAYEAVKEKEMFNALLADGDDHSDPDWKPLPGDSGDGNRWILPTNDQVQEELMNRRKHYLLDKLG